MHIGINRCVYNQVNFPKNFQFQAYSVNYEVNRYENLYEVRICHLNCAIHGSRVIGGEAMAAKHIVNFKIVISQNCMKRMYQQPLSDC